MNKDQIKIKYVPNVKKTGLIKCLFYSLQNTGFWIELTKLYLIIIASGVSIFQKAKN